MVVETAIHDKPIISVTIDTPGGWNMKDVYSLPLTAIGDWPTHQRFRNREQGGWLPASPGARNGPTSTLRIRLPTARNAASSPG